MRPCLAPALLVLLASASCVRFLGRDSAAPGDATRDAPASADGSLDRDPSAEGSPSTADLAAADTSAPPRCRDGICSAGETCASCPADCGECGCGDVRCDEPDVVCAGAGTLLGASGSRALSAFVVAAFPARGPIPAAGEQTTLLLCGLDLSRVTFAGEDPRNTTDLGAFAIFGLAPQQPASPVDRGLRLKVTSAGMDGTWDDQGVSLGPDDGFRKYLLQAWRDAEQLPIGHQYRNERAKAADPARYSTADRFDLRLELRAEDDQRLEVRAAARMHLSTATVDGCTWQWNVALNNSDVPDDAWTPLLTWGEPSLDDVASTTAPADAETLSLAVLLLNGASSANAGHEIAWAAARLIGPRPAP